jgi:hypothetical protein
MTSDACISRFPDRFPLNSQAASPVYVRDDALFAVHDADVDIPGCQCIGELGSGHIRMYRGTLPATYIKNSGKKVTPVYSLSPGGGTAVPTGRLFARFESKTDARAQESALHDIGFNIDSIPPYATFAAWVVSTTGQPEDAMRNIDKIRALQHMENVEPEMLRPITYKN